MSHCVPEATLKPKRLKNDVFVVQVYWEAVPKTWPSGREKTVHCTIK